jgi:isocitrate dehydrogenase
LGLLGRVLAFSSFIRTSRSVYNNPKALVLAEALDQATDKFLKNDKSPARRIGQIDNRGSHFYLSMYWAEASSSTKDQGCKLYLPYCKRTRRERSNN